jgi:hypothetical protein
MYEVLYKRERMKNSINKKIKVGKKTLTFEIGRFNGEEFTLFSIDIMKKWNWGWTIFHIQIERCAFYIGLNK